MEKHSSTINNGSKIKLLCSYGGRIQSRAKDHQLFYVGGDTKIVAVDRNIKFSEIAAKLNSLGNMKTKSCVSIKYQLPGEDLDSLVSLFDDEDVEYMIVEYDRMQRISTKPARLRLFVFDISPPTPKSGFKEACPVTALNPDYLFGFDKEYKPSIGLPADFSQIPSGTNRAENYGSIPCGDRIQGQLGITESKIVSANSTAAFVAAQTVYRVPAAVNGGVYRTEARAYPVKPEMDCGNREQPVCNIFQVMPQRRSRGDCLHGNNPEVKGNRRNI